MTRLRTSYAAAALALLFGAGLSTPAAAGQGASASPAAMQHPEESTDRLIVRLRDPSAPGVAGRIDRLGGNFGVRLAHFRQMSGGGHVVKIGQRLSHAEAHALARRLARDPNVAFVEPDVRVYPLRVPNDTRYGEQWDLYEAVGGINMPAAWDVTTGSASIVVAVIDTGVRPHADLAGRLVAGYDFIGDTLVANETPPDLGRDNDASDPGDYGCNGSGNSSWHGTHVAGTIGAVSNNGTGVVGVNWASKIQPVRVLGQCGGYTSDIVDGMRWAAGINLNIPGIPVNPTPARVENLSLGGGGPCSASFQNAINDVVARGTVVVVAAGNSNADAANTQPASCSGVIAVAATTRSGARASYSNYGAAVAIAAPGSGILSTLNAGATVPGADSYASYSGTSMATPHVAGVVSLMLSATPALTPAQVAAKLKSSARAFPVGTGDDCTTAKCGAGIVDAYAALTTAPVVVSPVALVTVNVALAGNGGVVTASSAYNNSTPAAAANNGDRKGQGWGSGGGWLDATPNVFGDWLQVDFNSVKSVGEIDVFTIQDNYANPSEPTETQTFSLYGITAYDVQYWDGTAWQTVPGGSVTGNNKVWRKFTFTPVSTSRIRVLVNGASADGYSRIVEVEAYATTTNVALRAAGATFQASSTYNSAFSVDALGDGDRRGRNFASGGGWHDATGNTFPDSVQVNFSSAKKIGEIGVFTLQDDYQNPIEPTATTTFSLYGVADFDVQYWTGSAWATVPGASVTGNRKVWSKFSFTPVTTTGIRIVVNKSIDGWSRLTEIEAYSAP